MSAQMSSVVKTWILFTYFTIYHILDLVLYRSIFTSNNLNTGVNIVVLLNRF